jgi:hypothetical protein
MIISYTDYLSHGVGIVTRIQDYFELSTSDQLAKMPGVEHGDGKSGEGTVLLLVGKP